MPKPTNTITLARQSKLGWACTTALPDGSFPVPDQPTKTGTYSQIMGASIYDFDFHKLVASKQPYHNTWFCRVARQWHRIVGDNFIHDLEEEGRALVKYE